MNNAADVTITGEATNSSFGNSVSTAGDVNGDGYSDIIVGAILNDAGGSNTGRAYIYYGGASMNNAADVTMTGEATNNYFGCSVFTAGDVNGDGYSDVIVGAYGYSSSTGRAYIYYGGASMNSSVDVTMTGEAIDNYFGRSVSTAGDVNGDGYSDVIVGADGYSSITGRAYIYYGGALMDDVADVTMTGESVNNDFGCSVSTAGDVNGDGYSDVIIGAWGYSSATGRAYIYYGSVLMNNVADVTMTGEASLNYFSVAVSTAGDVNGDGYSDVIAGAYSNDAGGTNAGRAYIFYGGASMDNLADVIMTGEATNTFFGYSVSTAGDVNGDGYSDVIIGGYGYSTITGRTYMYITQTPPVKPTLVTVKDVINDQGGKVNLTWARSGYDVSSINKITSYQIERRIPPSIGWETITDITALNHPYYSYVALTPFDSGNGQSGMVYYRVIAKTSIVNQYWISNLLSGYSVDNIPPLQVKNLAGSMDTSKIYLHWKHNTDEDLSKYRIYRNNIMIAEKTDTLLNDLSVQVDSIYKYRVAAVDIHGNEGAKSDSVQFVFGQLQLNLTVLIQGFYNDVSGLMVKDTVTVLLKNVTSPYATIDSGKIVLDSLGQGTIKFSNAIRNGTYYLVVRHRNALETWNTSGGLLFDKSINTYDFTTAITQAYGNNLLLKGTKYCIISGDVDQDGSIGALDRSACWNDRNLSGYYATDLDGDGSVGALDRSICWNNRNLAVQKPALMARLKTGQDKQNKTENKSSYDLKLNDSNTKKVERTK